MSQKTKRRLKRRSALAEILGALKPSDRAVFSHLDQMRGEGNVCTVSHSAIADAAEISLRQVQICVDRLIKAELVERVGYDLGNVILSRRGTIYRLLIAPEKIEDKKVQKMEKAIRDILRYQGSIETCLQELISLVSTKGVQE